MSDAIHSVNHVNADELIPSTFTRVVFAARPHIGPTNNASIKSSGTSGDWPAGVHAPLYTRQRLEIFLNLSASVQYCLRVPDRRSLPSLGNFPGQAADLAPTPSCIRNPSTVLRSKRLRSARDVRGREVGDCQSVPVTCADRRMGDPRSMWSSRKEKSARASYFRTVISNAV